MKGEKLTAHCLVGKILQTCSVSWKGIRAVMQQAWKSTKELKVESLGDNIFILTFASESEKKRILYGGPWHFDRALERKLRLKMQQKIWKTHWRELAATPACSQPRQQP